MMLINNVKNMFDNICNNKQSCLHKRGVTDKATETLRMFVLTKNSFQKVWKKFWLSLFESLYSLHLQRPEKGYNACQNVYWCWQYLPPEKKFPNQTTPTVSKDSISVSFESK